MFNMTIEQVKKEILKNKNIKNIGFRCYDKSGRIQDAGREELNRKKALKFLTIMIELYYDKCDIVKQSDKYVIVRYKA